eukprot:jgi/Tetstr1/466907/TSEL_011361.t1
MVDRSTALAFSALAGASYAGVMYLSPATYLQLDEVEPSRETQSLTRSAAAGIMGLTSFAYIALGDQHDVQTAACCSLATSMLGYLGNNIYRLFSKPTLGAKVDTAASATLLILCTGALLKHKA